MSYADTNIRECILLWVCCAAPVEKKYGPGNKTSILKLGCGYWFFVILCVGLWWAFDGFEDNQLPDGQICDHATSVLQQLRKNKTKGDDRPFFLAVGFHKPVNFLVIDH